MSEENNWFFDDDKYFKQIADEDYGNDNDELAAWFVAGGVLLGAVLIVLAVLLV